MDKLKMQTENKVDINIEKIGKLFPNTLTEKIKGYDENNKPIIDKAIDFDILKQELSKVIVEGREERYQMNWPGKKEAILTANAPINKTLRPCKEDSVNFDETENLYIEGDNLEVLKLLQETYLNKVKMIYIDPPYNTGNDSFVYNDDFSMSSEEFSEVSGQYDEDGNMNYDIRKNSESNGKFHTDWLNMMYPRLKLAKDLLSDDGVIFISIDENEVANMRKISDQIFGEQNLVGEVIWEKKFAPQNDAKYFSLNHEQLLCYAKNKVNFKRNLLPMTEEQIARYKNIDNDSRGPWQSDNLTVATYSEKYDFPIKTPSGKIINPPNGRCWRTSKEKFDNMVSDNRIWFGENGDNTPRIKRFLSEVQQGRVPISLWYYTEVGHTQEASKELKDIFNNKKFFDYPKPVKLLYRVCYIATGKNDIILDFFSGSATTAHAVMKLNAEDGGNRKFIMVQLPEETDEKSEARKAGYNNICEIGKERIRRAGKKIKEEHPEAADKLDTGFRVLKLDSSNMKDVYYNPNDYNQDMIEALESNIKQDRSGEDLLFQVMLDLGELLSSDIKEIDIEGKKVFNVADGSIIACFDDNITNEVLTEIAKMQPLYAVFRDSSLSNDSVATNFEQIFKTYSPNTIRKVL
jgi:adenine-specific DNA-methyltransferase